jgi:CheY-like chemotaxis protein
MVIDGADALQTARVVLIEDDALIRLGQETLLRDWGHRVATAASSDAIAEALGDNPADVAAIIADFDVGGLRTGVDIALQIAAGAGRPIPTAIMSARFPEMPRRWRASRSSANRSIRKNYTTGWRPSS